MGAVSWIYCYIGPKGIAGSPQQPTPFMNASLCDKEVLYIFEKFTFHFRGVLALQNH